jgi:hypothetical protein
MTVADKTPWLYASIIAPTLRLVGVLWSLRQHLSSYCHCILHGATCSNGRKCVRSGLAQSKDPMSMLAFAASVSLVSSITTPSHKTTSSKGCSITARYVVPEDPVYQMSTISGRLDILETCDWEFPGAMAILILRQPTARATERMAKLWNC